MVFLHPVWSLSYAIRGQGTPVKYPPSRMSVRTSSSWACHPSVWRVRALDVGLSITTKRAALAAERGDLRRPLRPANSTREADFHLALDEAPFLAGAKAREQPIEGGLVIRSEFEPGEEIERTA